MKKITLILLLLIFVGAPVTYAASDFAYNRLCNLAEPLEVINEEGTNLDVIVGDQTTPPLLVYMNAVGGYAELVANFSVDDYNITVNDSTGVTVGDYIGVFNLENNRFYTGSVLDINGNIITMDTPSDFDYVIGDGFQYGKKDMNVDGSGTPIIYSLRADPNLNITVDVTRIIIHMTDNVAMDDEKFGGLDALTRGVVLRRKDGIYQNIFNVKTNGEIGELAFDKSYDLKAPSGFFGFSSRLTFAGPSKLGVAIRLRPDEDLQLIIQDDLTGLNTFRIMVEGHVVVNGN